jgi:transcriptional regulator with XRE-family HTH domain
LIIVSRPNPAITEILLGEEALLPRPAKQTVVSKEQIGERVKALRHARDLSQGQLAAMLGIPATNVSAIERGVRGLSIQQLVKLAKAFDVPPGQILDGYSSSQSRKARTARQPRRFERIRSLPRTKRRVLYEIIDAFLDKHG